MNFKHSSVHPFSVPTWPIIGYSGLEMRDQLQSPPKVLNQQIRATNLFLLYTEDICVCDQNMNMRCEIRVSAFTPWYVDLGMSKNIKQYILYNPSSISSEQKYWIGDEPQQFWSKVL